MEGWGSGISWGLEPTNNISGDAWGEEEECPEVGKTASDQFDIQLIIMYIVI